MLTVGVGSVTVTVIVCVADVPSPVQVISYSVVFDSRPVIQLPLVDSGPLQPPEAVHALAFTAFQLRVTLPMLLTVVREAVRLTAGPALTVIWLDCEVCPPAPVQVSV
jgi:hypothetical protein